jgi:AhpC/TSA family
MTNITILHEQQETQLSARQAQASAEALWLDRAAIEKATGWTWKPEGLCHDETCVPLPKSSTPLVRDESLDMAQMWRHMGNPVVHDAASETWVLGTGSGQRMDALATLEAPDFALPDLAGQIHRLSDYRGKKVFLATWASW